MVPPWLQSGLHNARYPWIVIQLVGYWPLYSSQLRPTLCGLIWAIPVLFDLVHGRDLLMISEILKMSHCLSLCVSRINSREKSHTLRHLLDVGKLSMNT